MWVTTSFEAMHWKRHSNGNIRFTVPVVCSLRGRGVAHQARETEHVGVGGAALTEQVGHGVPELVRGDGDADEALSGALDEVGNVCVRPELGVLGLSERREEQV